MSATLECESGNLYLLRINETLTQSGFQRVQDQLAKDIDNGVQPRVLTVLENFAGWERPAVWGNLDFQYWYSNEITKIAIVCEPQWTDEALRFAGAWKRNAPVKHFAPGRVADARAWLAA